MLSMLNGEKQHPEKSPLMCTFLLPQHALLLAQLPPQTVWTPAHALQCCGQGTEGCSNWCLRSNCITKCSPVPLLHKSQSWAAALNTPVYLTCKYTVMLQLKLVFLAVDKQAWLLASPIFTSGNLRPPESIWGSVSSTTRLLSFAHTCPGPTYTQSALRWQLPLLSSMQLSMGTQALPSPVQPTLHWQVAVPGPVLVHRAFKRRDREGITPNKRERVQWKYSNKSPSSHCGEFLTDRLWFQHWGRGVEASYPEK